MINNGAITAPFHGLCYMLYVPVRLSGTNTRLGVPQNGCYLSIPKFNIFPSREMLFIQTPKVGKFLVAEDLM
jgi:hypothetical protein